MSLPADCAAYMLHEAPLLLVKRLLKVDGDDAEAETVLELGDVGVAPDGSIEAAVLLELMAQTYAAARGYLDHTADASPHLGYLVGASNVRIERIPRVGRRLHILVRSTRSFESFYAVEGRILSDGQLVAQGTLKAWMQARD